MKPSINEGAHVKNVWFSPPEWVILIFWMFCFGTISYIIWKGHDSNEQKIRNNAIVNLFFTVCMFFFFYKRMYLHAVFTALKCILTGYFVYNNIFISEIVSGGNDLELNLIATYLLIITFLLMLIVASHTKRP